jgi:membrane-bound lytic murein transglycosylase B
MNQTCKGAIPKVESAYGFIKTQVDAFNKKKQKRYSTIRHGVTMATIAVMMIVTAAPVRTIGAPESTPAPTAPEFTSAISLDTQSHSLLVIENQPVEITVGKSREDERLAAQAAAARARAQAAAKAAAAKTTTPVSPKVAGASTTVTKVSADEAHRIAQDAAAKAGIPQYWKVLAAIWQVESGKAVHSCIVSKADGRAVGPMQFMPSTFRAYATDGDGDGSADICNAKDALVSAAHLLKRGGIAAGNVDGAIHNYNHSMAYVNKVKQIASNIN